MTLTSFVGSFRSRHRRGLRPHLTLNTSLATSHLGTIHSGESLNIKPFESNQGSATTSSTCVPASPTGTVFSLATSSAESMRSFDTQVTTPDDSVPRLYCPCPDNHAISDEDEPSSPSPSGTPTIFGNTSEKEPPTVLDEVETKRMHKAGKKKEGNHDCPCRRVTFVPTQNPGPSLSREEDDISLFPSTTPLPNRNPTSSSRTTNPTPFVSTMTSVSNERLSFEDNYDPHSVDSGIEFLKMFLREKWELQMEMCRIVVSDKVTLSSLMDIGKETSKEGIPKCRNLIECPGINDDIAISLWEFLSGSVPSSDDLLQDDDTSVVSLEFVERFILVREKPKTPKDTAVVSVEQIEEVEPVEDVQEVQPDQPVQQDLQVQTVQQVQQVDRSQPPTRTGRSKTFSASNPAGSPSQGRMRRVQSASFFLRDMIPRLKDWGRRQAEALNETGIAMGRGLGSQPYNDDYVELRIFILKALNQLGRTAASGVMVMQSFQGSR